MTSAFLARPTLRPLRPLRPGLFDGHQTRADAGCRRSQPLCDLIATSAAKHAAGSPRSQPGRKTAATSESQRARGIGACPDHQVAEVAEVAAIRDLPQACSSCGCGSWVRPPNSRWRCAGCDPVRLPPAHEQAGWRFAAVGQELQPRSPVPKSPEPRPAVVYLDGFLAWTKTALIGRCRSCRFSGPISDRQLCAPCEVDRLLAAGDRSVASPDALADEAEIVIRGEPLP